MDVYTKNSAQLNNLAQQISQSMQSKISIEPTCAEPPDPILISIQYALTKVKDGDKFNCMLDVLQYIKDRYM